MSQSEVIVTANPRGVHGEGIIVGTPKPGICVSLVNQTPVEGRFYYEPWNGAASGERSEVVVLTEDFYQGRAKEDAYATGSRCFLYWPAMGEELKMLFKDEAGTADDHAIGEKIIIEDGTGLMIPSASTPEMEPFVLLEAITDPAAAFWGLVRYTGH